MLATVSFERLDLFRSRRDSEGRRDYMRLRVDAADLDAVRACVRFALNL